MSSRYLSFSYLTADKSSLYLRIMQLFVEAKARFTLHLRASDIASELRDALAIDDSELGRALDSLCSWGNLESHPDLAEVATVEEFRRPRFLYQMTPEGEATEQAVRTFLATMGRRGELQAAALGDIRDLLRELLTLARPPTTLDERIERESKILRSLTALCQRFDDLTSRAQAFLASIMRPSDLYASSSATFVAYKDLLISYIERFVGELARMSELIAGLICEVEQTGLDDALAIAAERELIDAVEKTADDLARARARWRGRWDGLRSWFLGQANERTQADLLRERARAAIRALVQAVQYLNDRHMTRTDRVADLRALARWFLQAPTDDDAHRLWRAAFGLAPARHLGIDGDTLDAWDAKPIQAQTAWADAPPIVLSPRLLKTGSYEKRGRKPDIVDKSNERARLAALAEEEARQIGEAEARLMTDGPMLLSDLPRLGAREFGLFLDLLGEALAARSDPAREASAVSADGTLEIILTPVAGSLDVTIDTDWGRFTGPEHLVEIFPAGTERPRRARVARAEYPESSAFLAEQGR